MNIKAIALFCCFVFSSLFANAENYRIPRISPLPDGIENQRILLNGEWLFNPSPTTDFWKNATREKWNQIDVPGEWVMQGFEVEPGEAAAYSRTFQIPEAWQGERIKLRCNGIYSDCQIYINGKPATSHLGGFTAFETDITDLIFSNHTNRIDVSVRSESLADSAASGAQYAVHPLGGITRDIYLYSLPDVNLSSFHATTSFDSTYTNAVLAAAVEISNESIAQIKDLSVVFSLQNKEGKNIPIGTADFPINQIQKDSSFLLNTSFQVANPQKWDPEHPNLYTFVCQLKSGNKILHETHRKIGFREIEVRGNQLFVNNHPVKLRGVCRHEVMPLRGRSLTGDIWKQDVALFRQGNVNYIRTSHYPPDEALLDACDELGMFVEVEAPFCWAHNTQIPDSMRYPVLVNQHIEMVHLNRSHPSVIMWSLGNESNLFMDYFQQAADIIKEIDPTRPRIFSQWGPDADGGALEITNHHYPGPDGPTMYRKSKRPVIFDEFCHLNAYNRLELASDPGLRSSWGELLDRMWNDMYKSQGVLGGAIWAGIDDTFFLPNGKAVGYGTWGPIDGWRREKPEYWGMKKAFSPVRITLKGNSPKNGLLEFDIENRHDFSNLSECTIQWRTSTSQSSIHPDISAHTQGQMQIQLPPEACSDAYLDLEVIGVRGFVIDQYHFQLLPNTEETKKRKLKNTQVFRLQENDKEYLVQSGKTRYIIDKRNGLLSICTNGNDTIIEQGPQLMILPLNGEGGGIQMTGTNQTFEPYNIRCQNWIATSVGATLVDNDIIVEVKGSYKEAEGSYRYLFTPNKNVSIDYQFKLKETINPRQIGLVFTLPSTYDQLSWDRKGYWTNYPADHISALQGEAKAYDPNSSFVGLAGPSQPPIKGWSFDQTKAGSNRFRSTKENIYSASLKNEEGSAFTVSSDGTDHIRSWIENGKCLFLFASYSNAGKENFLIPHAEKDYKPLKKGDIIEGSCNFCISE